MSSLTRLSGGRASENAAKPRRSDIMIVTVFFWPPKSRPSADLSRLSAISLDMYRPKVCSMNRVRTSS